MKRKLLITEIVHHINGDKQDNRFKNLSLLSSQSKHRLEHKPSAETKRKISNKLKGCAFSIIHRKNLSIALIGNTNGKLYER